MRKSVLVIDTPEKCLDCNLCVLDMDGSISCYYNKREICSNVEENNSRPEWCPLRELPNKKEYIIPIDNVESQKDIIAVGWNACIDAIKGETNERK